jgi:hypothetical protein
VGCRGRGLPRIPATTEWNVPFLPPRVVAALGESYAMEAGPKLRLDRFRGGGGAGARRGGRNGGPRKCGVNAEGPGTGAMQVGGWCLKGEKRIFGFGG